MDNMKKLFSQAGIQSTFNNTINAVTSQIKQGLDSEPTDAPAQQRQQPAITPPANPASGDKQYLRLPIESARKLRWYDKGDVAIMVKTHVREKHELMDTIAALKKVLLRCGITEASLDAEVHQLIGRAESIRVADEGVYSVLLTSATTEMEALQLSNNTLHQKMEDMQERMRSMDDVISVHNNRAAHAPEAVPTFNPDVAYRLSTALECYEQCQAGSALLARQLRSQEQDIVVREAVESMRILMASSSAAVLSRSATGSGSHSRTSHEFEADFHTTTTSELNIGEAGEGDQFAEKTGGDVNGDGAVAGEANGGRVAAAGGQQQQQRHQREQLQQLARELGVEREKSLSLVAKLQRLEMERRVHVEEASEMSERLRSLSSAQSSLDSYRTSLASAEERCRLLTASVDLKAVELTAARSAARAAEEIAERRSSDVRKLTQSASQSEALARYQDLCVDAEERAISAERRAAASDARVGKLEVKLREMQVEAKSSALQLSSATQQLAAAAARAAAAEAASEVAVAAALMQPAPDSIAQNATRIDQLVSLQAAVDVSSEALAAAERELTVVMRRLEGMEIRAQAAESRESRMAAELRESEVAVMERDELEAQVTALRDKLSETRAERSQAEHYRQVCSELESSRVRVEDELVSTAQLVTQLEARLQEALQRGFEAETTAQCAEARIRNTEAAVASEVESRMAAASSNRVMWPRALREEVGRIESRVEGLQSMLGAAHAESERQASAAAAQGRMRADCQRQTVDLEERVLRMEREHAEEVQHLSILLQEFRASAAAAACLSNSQAQLGSRTSSANMSLSVPHRLGSYNSNQGKNEPSLDHHADGNAVTKWQVQNRVGGGSLYGVDDVVVHTHDTHGHRDSTGTSSLVRNNSSDASLAGLTPHAQRHHNGSLEDLNAEAGRETPWLHSTSSDNLALPLSMLSLSTANPTNATTTATASLFQLLPMTASTPKQRPRNSSSSTGEFSVSLSNGDRTMSTRSLTAAVDIVYMKNVLLKFLEAHATGKIVERDALFPAVAALLQASPAEFKAFKKVLANTNPASTQLWSVLGMGGR